MINLYGFLRNFEEKKNKKTIKNPLIQTTEIEKNTIKFRIEKKKQRERAKKRYIK